MLLTLLVSFGSQLIDAVKPPIDRDGPSVLQRFVEVLSEAFHRFLLQPVQVQRRSDRVQVLRRGR